MPRTKPPQPGPLSDPQPPPTSVNGPSSEVLTLAEAAAYLRLPEADVVSLVHSQGLPGRCTADEWRLPQSGHPALARHCLAELGDEEGRHPGTGRQVQG